MSFDEEGRNNNLDTFPPTWTFQRHRDVRAFSSLVSVITRCAAFRAMRLGGKRSRAADTAGSRPDESLIRRPSQRYDFMAPHYYTRPDSLCDTVPFGAGGPMNLTERDEHAAEVYEVCIQSHLPGCEASFEKWVTCASGRRVGRLG